MSDPVSEFIKQEQEDMAALGLDDAAPPPVVLPASEDSAASLPPSFDASAEFAPEPMLGETPAPVVEALGEVKSEEPFSNGLSNSLSNGLSNGDFSNGLTNGGLGNGVDVPSIPREEPETIRRWRVEFAERLDAKDAAEKEAIAAMKAEAAAALEDFHKQRGEAQAKKASENRKSEAEEVALRDSTDGGKEWERIARMCEFNPKAAKSTKDVSRMRGILLQKKTEKA